MARYRKLADPLLPFAVIQAHRKGEEFDAELDEATERRLVGIGALVRLKDPEPEEKPSEPVAAQPDEQPEPEPEPEQTGVVYSKLEPEPQPVRRGPGRPPGSKNRR